MQIHFRTCALLALAGAALLASSCADAFIYTVGRSGTGNNCSYATVQAAINAAAASTEDDEIWITRDVAGGYYQNQALTIENLRGKLKIVGGFDDCRDVTPDGVTELHGNGGPRDSVLHIGGGNVTLSRLRFTRGDEEFYGGGVMYFGAGSLLIEDSIIDNNRSDRGGAGLVVRTYGGAVTFAMSRTEVSDNRTNGAGGGIEFSHFSTPHAINASFGDDVRINRNYALEGGGGLYAESSTKLDVLGNGFQMQANGTLGDGGAILAESGANNFLIMPGRRAAGSLGTFVGNEAQNGGAIALRQAVEWPVGGDTLLQLGSGDFNDPQVFFANRAHGRGGAIYVDRPRIEGPLDGATRVCAFNVGFEGNDAAGGGSAVMATGSSAFFRNRAQGPGCNLPPTPCTHVSCNHYTGHKATRNNAPSQEGNLFSALYANIDLFGVRIAYNELSHLFSSAGEPAASLSVDTALIYKNSVKTLGGNVGCSSTPTCRFDMIATTIVANTLTERVFLNNVNNFHLRESIIDQPGTSFFLNNPTGTTSTLEHVLYNAHHSFGTLPPTVRYGQPGFMNVAAMDYRLSGNSEAIDNLPAREGVDFIGRDRNVDIPGRPNALGPRDLGAVETQLWEVGVIDVIFRNGFD